MNKIRSLCYCSLFLLGFLSFFTLLCQKTYASVPAGFTETKLAGGLKNPTTIRFAPNGDVYIGQQGGSILIYRNGTVLSTPVITLNTNSTGELGLLGLELDPNFAANGYIYVSYTGADNYARLSRFTVTNDVANPSSEVVFYKGNQTANPHHSANDLHLGPDGKLWWTVGDNVPAISNAQTLTNIYGKILRFNLDGSIPLDNPFLNYPNAVSAIYAYGLRNPFRFTFLPNGKAMVADTGSSYWEEMNTIQNGGNYGWPFVEGFCGSCGFINPSYAYGHLPVDGAISALAAYNGSTFPSDYANVVFFGDYNRQDIEAVKFDSTYQTEISDTVFDTAAGTIADLEQGPDGNLYYVGIFEGSFFRIAPTGPFAPTAVASATPQSGTAPLQVQFSSAGSHDAFNQSVMYSWDFGDGSSSSLANPSHTYDSNGTYTALLTVSNGSQASSSAQTITVGNTPPVVSMTSPAANAIYNLGDTVNYSATATDAKDGTLPASAYSWKVDFYRGSTLQPFYFNEQPVPFVGPVSGVTSGSFTIPQDVSNDPATWYRITLTVTDSLGLSTTVTRDINPNLTNWNVSTNIGNAPFFVDGTWQLGNFTAQDIANEQHVLSGVASQTIGGTKYRFHDWSDGGAFMHQITNKSSGSFIANYDTVQNSISSPWQSTDIGNPLMKGTADYSSSSNTFYIDGAGADIWGTNDQFHYVYQPISGDATIIARLRYQTDSSDWAKAGVMFKESTASMSAYVNLFATQDVASASPNVNGIDCTPDGCAAPLPPITPAVGHGVHMQYNFKSDKSVTSSTALSAFKSPNKWLKLQRVGNTFTSYYSSDGQNWSLIGSTSVTMNSNATVGLFDTSHNIGQFSSTAFDNVSIIPAGGVTPTPTPTPTSTPTPTPTNTPTPIPSPSQVQVSNLQINDTTNAKYWSLQTNLQVGNVQYGDRSYTLSSVPSNLLGTPWIRTANGSKSYTGSTLVSFTISQQATVYIALDTRLKTLPSWLDSTWTKTALTLTDSQSAGSNTFLLYAKSFPAGSVTLGPNSATGITTVNMYSIFVQ